MAMIDIIAIGCTLHLSSTATATAAIMKNNSSQGHVNPRLRIGLNDAENGSSELVRDGERASIADLKLEPAMDACHDSSD
jgi:hypothetical protein